MKTIRLLLPVVLALSAVNCMVPKAADSGPEDDLDSGMDSGTEPGTDSPPDPDTGDTDDNGDSEDSGNDSGDSGNDSGDSGSGDTGTEIDPAHELFCTGYQALCSDVSLGTPYTDCLAEIAAMAPGTEGDFNGDTFSCRAFHLQVTTTDPATHCPHASPDGGGVCS